MLLVTYSKTKTDPSIPWLKGSDSTITVLDGTAELVIAVVIIVAGKSFVKEAVQVVERLVENGGHRGCRKQL